MNAAFESDILSSNESGGAFSGRGGGSASYTGSSNLSFGGFGGRGPGDIDLERDSKLFS